MEENENIEIRRIIDIILSKKVIILFILITSILLGYFYSYYYIVPEYKSTTTLLIVPGAGNGSKGITATDLTLNSELITTYTNIIKNSKVLNKVISNLELNYTEQKLAQEVQVTASTDTYIIDITVTDKNAEIAMKITKEIAKVFLEEVKTIYNLSNINVIDEANLPQSAYNINHIKDITLFFGIGIFITALYVMIIYIFDNTIKKEEEIEKYIKIKSLGIIPVYSNKKQNFFELNNAKSYVTECINTIRTNILYMNSAKNAKTILITSCTPKEGKSWIASSIATSFAETNKKVLLIDCDMRKGRLNKIFKVSNKEGLSDYIYNMKDGVIKNVELAQDFIKETKVPNLHILTNGIMPPPYPSELLASENMKKLLTIFKNMYDIIILDAPPCKLVTDSIVLSNIVDSTILVASSRTTKINDLKETKKAIQSVGGEIIGSILNKVKIKDKAYIDNNYYAYKDNKEKEITEQNIITVEQIIKESMPIFKEKKNSIFEEDHKEKKLISRHEITANLED